MASTYTALLIHVVFSTRDRRPLLDPAWVDALYAYIGGILREDGGRLVAAGGVEDHVHLVLQFKPDRSVSQTLARLKAVSSKWLNQSGRLAERFEWQRGYGAFSVSRSDLDSLRRYVAGQREHHRRESYRDELVRFLDEHCVEYEQRFLLG